MIDRNDVEVWVSSGGADRRAGTLRPSFMGGRALAASSFEYDGEFLADGWQLSPDLPLRPGRIYTAENSTLPGAFSDAAPDDWGRRIIQADHARRRRGGEDLPRPLGEFDYLLGVSDHARMGALRFARGRRWLSTDEGVANIHELGRIIEAAQRYDDDEATDDDVAYLGQIATSPGGARPKANVELADGHLAIAKLPHSKDGRFDVEAWEGVALTLAADAGLSTPRWQLLSRDGRRNVLLSTRFDRTQSGERLGYLSARTALELGANDDGSRLTYEDFSDTIADLSTHPSEDLHEMFGRIALTVLVNNVDDHWRNHGFIRAASGWRLTPMFDVNPSRSRGVLASRQIDGSDDPRDRRLDRLLAVADAFRLRPVAARAVIHRVATAVAEWRSVARLLGISPAEIDAYAVAFDTTQLQFALALGPK